MMGNIDLTTFHHGNVRETILFIEMLDLHKYSYSGFRVGYVSHRLSQCPKERKDTIFCTTQSEGSTVF